MVSGHAPFQTVTQSEIPDEWKAPSSAEAVEEASKRIAMPMERIEGRVVIELPDVCISKEYQDWVAMEEVDDTVGVIITSQSDFVKNRGKDMFLKTIESLVKHGKPELLWTMIWYTKP